MNQLLLFRTFFVFDQLDDCEAPVVLLTIKLDVVEKQNCTLVHQSESQIGIWVLKPGRRHHERVNLPALMFTLYRHRIAYFLVVQPNCDTRSSRRHIPSSEVARDDLEELVLVHFSLVPLHEEFSIGAATTETWVSVCLIVVADHLVVLETNAVGNVFSLVNADRANEVPPLLLT